MWLWNLYKRNWNERAVGLAAFAALAVEIVVLVMTYQPGESKAPWSFWFILVGAFLFWLPIPSAARFFLAMFAGVSATGGAYEYDALTHVQSVLALTMGFVVAIVTYHLVTVLRAVRTIVLTALSSPAVTAGTTVVLMVLATRMDLPWVTLACLVIPFITHLLVVRFTRPHESV